MFGLLNIDKPAGMTSRDVVNRVQRLVRPVKVGHAGTLDPLATGVLVLCLGQATRLIEYVQRLPKRYRAVFLLGRESDTEDIEGRVLELADARPPRLEELQAALPAFLGQIEQRPPAFSALKVAGKRAYRLARQGEQVELAPRKITVRSLSILAYEYPRLELEVECGSGTYVRSLGRDLARAVGSGAVMSALVRTAIGDFHLADACPLAGLTAATVSGRLLSPLQAVAMFPTICVSPQEAMALGRGQLIENRLGVSAEELAAVSETGQLVAIAIPKHGKLAAGKYFPE